MKSPDKVSSKLRKVEKEIDNHYKSNPLVELPFATAAWSLLAFAEFESLKQVSNVSTSQELETQSDNFINELKEPMFWLFRACEQGGQIPSAYDDDVFQASWDLFKLGKKYQWFEAAYTYASNGLIKLELEGSTIQPAKEFFKGMEYQAYGRLIKAHQTDEGISLINVDDFHLVREAISSSVKVVEGNRFSYKMNPRMVSDVIKTMSPGYDMAFSLPPEWRFSRYSLGDFRKVFEAILAIASIHFRAWRIAIEKECDNMGYLDCIYVPTCNELLRRVARYSGVPDAKVLSIFDDLTYGNRGILHPDPALQPLIKLNSNHYAIMPSLWMSLSPERNLTVILNRIPSEREIYAELVGEQEELMKRRFTTDLSTEGFQFIEGNVSSDLPDIDLAIIRDSEKACLLLELKWFIGPAEFREVIDKSKAIKKGVCQSLKFKQAFAASHEPLLAKLGIDTDYRLETVVVSQNWIGYANVQNLEVPVILADHLIAKLKATESLRSTMDWLKNREYLPKEGKDFEVHGITSTIGKWNLKWSTTRPLIKDAFFPL
ncbi:hypothetical protein C6499_15895 [Candidatus Poribacteria bacterium]|nr:MAG: hypothetical protein C6499_15895 [Candidatus Poribacteria bacterium]